MDVIKKKRLGIQTGTGIKRYKGKASRTMMNVIFFWTGNQHFKQAEKEGKGSDVWPVSKGLWVNVGEKKSRDNVVWGFHIKIRIKIFDFRDYTQMDNHFCCLYAGTSEEK